MSNCSTLRTITDRLHLPPSKHGLQEDENILNISLPSLRKCCDILRSSADQLTTCNIVRLVDNAVDFKAYAFDLLDVQFISYPFSR